MQKPWPFEANKSWFSWNIKHCPLPILLGIPMAAFCSSRWVGRTNDSGLAASCITNTDTPPYLPRLDISI